MLLRSRNKSNFLDWRHIVILTTLLILGTGAKLGLTSSVCHLTRDQLLSATSEHGTNFVLKVVDPPGLNPGLLPFKFNALSSCLQLLQNQ